MIPLVNAEVMRDCDARAVAERGVDALVAAAGFAVAGEARRMLGSLYGRRVAVIAGPGLNGRDGVVAAGVLRSRGCQVDLIAVADQPARLERCELVIDAAYGLGCRRPYDAPEVADATLVLSVDLPSGVDADTGALLGRPVRADVTLAIGALKFAHVDGPAAACAGQLRFASLGIATPLDNALVTDDDLAGFVRAGTADHKWTHAVSVLAGSRLMPGAARLVCEGALSAGASMVRLTSRGKIAKMVRLPPEVVRVEEPLIDSRSRSLVAGPGLGADATPWLLERLPALRCPVVLDADALSMEVVSAAGQVPRILTPHQGEFDRLGGRVHEERRIEAVRRLAAELGCVILLKGPITVVASPSGQVRVVTSGTSALATAGSGDVLAGMIAASLARGHEVLDAAALSAHLHGRAGSLLTQYQSASHLASAVTSVLRHTSLRHEERSLRVGAGGLEPSTSAV